MDPHPDLLAASGWRRTFDGTALPDGAAFFVAERRAPGAGAILVLGGARGPWVDALLGACGRVAVLDVSRRDLRRLEARFGSSGPGGARPLLVHGDPRDFETVPGASSVLVPSPLLASLATGEERRDLLRCARKQAGAGGRVVLHHEPIPFDLLPAGDERLREVEQSPYALAGEGGAGTRTTTAGRDAATGRFLLVHAFRRPGAEVVEESGLLLADLDHGTILGDLEAAGLEPVGTHGGFDASPPVPGGPLIVVAAPRPR